MNGYPYLKLFYKRIAAAMDEFGEKVLVDRLCEKYKAVFESARLNSLMGKTTALKLEIVDDEVVVTEVYLK